jgi:hypothetical protein
MNTEEYREYRRVLATLVPGLDERSWVEQARDRAPSMTEAAWIEAWLLGNESRTSYRSTLLPYVQIVLRLSRRKAEEWMDGLEAAWSGVLEHRGETQAEGARYARQVYASRYDLREFYAALYNAVRDTPGPREAGERHQGRHRATKKGAAQ